MVDVANSTLEVSTYSKDITKSMRCISEIATQNSADAEEVAATHGQLSSMVGSLSDKSADLERLALSLQDDVSDINIKR